MSNRTNEALVAAMKQKAPNGDTLVNKLVEMLSLSKVAIYRRLRSEVPFTYDEVTKIAIHYDISLDQLMGADINLNKSKWAVADLDMLFTSTGNYRQYCNKISSFADLFRDMQYARSAKMYCAANIFPHTFILPFENLSRFFYYKWNYLVSGVNPNYCFSKMETPAEVKEVNKRFMEEAKHVQRTLYILSRSLFTDTVSDIRKFHEHGLITEKELELFKKDLHGLLGMIERIAATGCNDAGKETVIYLSDITLDASYVYLECDHQTLSIHRSFFIDSLNFKNSTICRIQRDWVEMLKRYSTLITQCCELQRFEYIGKQRKLIDELSSNGY